jgi:hypothetical protein
MLSFWLWRRVAFDMYSVPAFRKKLLNSAASEKLRKSTVSPSETTLLPLDGFPKKRSLNIFRKSVEKIQVSLKCYKFSVYFTWSPSYIYDCVLPNSLKREIFRTKAVGKTKTHISWSITFFPANSVVYEIKWNTMVQPEKPQMKFWRMRIACWISETTNTHAKHVKIFAPPQ